MLKDEWLSIGYEKGLIDEVSPEEWLTFEEVYKRWFLTKVKRIKPQSVDRIEVTYNRYYDGTDLVKMPVHLITETVVYNFLNHIIISRGDITQKELGRMYQIVNNVMQYGFDLNLGRCYCVNWSMVKRYLALNCLKAHDTKELCVSLEDRRTLARAILVEKIYSEKRSACLCLLLNFYLGLRIGELAALRWSDVNWTEKYIYIHSTEVKAYARDDTGERLEHMEYVNQDRTKTPHSMRTVPLVKESIYILQELQKWHQTQEYESEFLAYDGTDIILTKSLEWTLRRLCIMYDIPKFSTHRIRKTFASELHRNGVPTKMISDVMGHAEIRTTERNYIISYGDTLGAVRDAMQKGLFIPLSD